MPDQTNAPDQHDHDKRVHDLFMQVVDLPQQEQRAFLDNACGDDTDLRNDVLELLRFNEQQTKTVVDHKSHVRRITTNDACPRRNHRSLYHYRCAR